MQYIDIFDQLEPHERLNLMDRATVKHFASGDTIVSQGSDNTSIYVISDGEVQVLLESDEGSQELARLGIGTIFGEMTYLTHGTASATVVACEEVEVLCLEHSQILAMTHDDPEFAGRFYRSLAITLAYRLRHTNRQIERS